jgi:sugar fermentation stimulation protein A
MTDVYRPFDTIFPATFLNRPNRFLVECEWEGGRTKAFLPNPGRLQELLLPDTRLYLTRQSEQGNRKTSFTVVGVERDGCPIMLHTHKTNDAVSYLLSEGLVPGLEETTIVRREVTVGRSRFDFLLEDRKGKIFVEVKSCTLFGKSVAMFPDAITARGARHLRELADLSEAGSRSAVIFMIHWPFARTFMPDYHTDLAFARTLVQVRNRVQIIPLSVTWQQDMSLLPHASLLDVPWEYIEREAKDAGSYLLVLQLDEDRVLPQGKAATASLRKGFYIYVGSAMANLSARLERHLRLRKRFQWHIDWLRAHASVRAALPIRASDRLECALAEAVAGVAEWSVPGFGCSDCTCPSHLFGMSADPLSLRPFHEVLQYFRMDRSVGQGFVTSSSKRD